MAIEVCVRCGKKTAKMEQCKYCGRRLCVDCIKSTRKPSKTERLSICKDCWSKMEKRKEFKAVGRKPEAEFY